MQRVWQFVVPGAQSLVEPSVGDRAGEVSIRRGDESDIGADRPSAADGRELARLEHAQQPGLRLHRHVADLVEEQRAAGRLLETPRSTGLRAGKGAAFMAEQDRKSTRLNSSH